MSLSSTPDSRTPHPREHSMLTAGGNERHPPPEAPHTLLFFLFLGLFLRSTWDPRSSHTLLLPAKLYLLKDKVIHEQPHLEMRTPLFLRSYCRRLQSQSLNSDPQTARLPPCVIHEVPTPTADSFPRPAHHAALSELLQMPNCLTNGPFSL